MTTTPQVQLRERITAYLAMGGLFNPEQANHDAVRDLLIDCRAALSTLPELAAAPAAGEPTALQRFNENGLDAESPLERLRYFCSLAMCGQDWLDVEPFFDALQTHLVDTAVPSLGLHATEGRAETCDEQAAWLLGRVCSYQVDYDTTIERARQRDGNNKWAVRRHGEVLGRGGEWEYEPLPSSRDDAFLARCRFNTAQEAAEAVRQYDNATVSQEPTGSGQ